MSEHVLDQGVQDVQTVDAVALGDGQIEADQGHRVGLGDAQRRVQRGDEIRQLREPDELTGVRIVPETRGNWNDLGTLRATKWRVLSA